MFLNNIRLYLADPQTGLLEMRFICHYCGREIMGEPRHWQLLRPCPGIRDSYELRFWCNNAWCHKQDKE